MDWLKLFLIALDLVGQFGRWIEREKILDEARKAQLREALENIDAAVAKAEAARSRVRADLGTNPERLRDPEDRFRRPD